jgi:hypothetical protein
MNENAVAILERLLTQEPGPGNAHYLRVSRDFYDADWTYEEVQAIEDAFAQDFRAVTAEVKAAWGPPEFIGHRKDSDFPEFYTAEGLCYWRKGDRLAMIWWEHQDKEVPVLLTLAVLKPEDVTG